MKGAGSPTGDQAMKKMNRILAVAALLSGAAQTAQATEGWYGRADAGYSFESTATNEGGPEFELDDNWMGALGLGYAFDGGFRVEGELAYRNNDVVGTGQESTETSLMLNAFYDFNRGGRFQPYI